MMNAEQGREILSELNQEIRAAIRAGTHDTNYPAGILNVLLAELFSYHVTAGGFSQLLYNLRGAYLPETEEMLEAADAVVAKEYYIKAIQECLKDGEAYHRFLDNNFTDQNNLKDQLHLISVDYFKTGVDFFTECSYFIQNSRLEVEQWLKK